MSKSVILWFLITI